MGRIRTLLSCAEKVRPYLNFDMLQTLDKVLVSRASVLGHLAHGHRPEFGKETIRHAHKSAFQYQSAEQYVGAASLTAR